MKKLFLIAGFLIGNLVYGQIPPGYYDSAAGLDGLPLKTALYNIIDGHTSISYSNLYSAYVTTDNLPTNKVWDMYSIKADGTANYWFINSANNSDQCGSYSGEGDCYNREHSTPASWFNDATPMYSDLFNVYPTDGYVNNRRSNYPMAKVGTASWTSSNGSKVGGCSTTGYSGTVFEPIDSFKGDFARTFFYMATRYENLVANWPSNSSECAAVYAGNSGFVFKTYYITMLLAWDDLDPVSQKEINRNNAVYAKQHNRNPYIDHPEWVECVWSTCAVGLDDSYVNDNNCSIYPNPGCDKVTVSFTSATEAPSQIAVYSIEGKCLIEKNYSFMNENKIVIATDELATGVYIVKITNSNVAITKQLIIQK